MSIESPDHMAINQLAFEQGMIGLSGQEGLLNSIRQRAVGIGGLSGAAAAFLGREALKSHTTKCQYSSDVLQWLYDVGFLSTFSLSEWIALIFLFISIIGVVQMLQPRKGFVFHFSPGLIVNQFSYGEKATSISNTYKILSSFAEDNYAKNKVLIKGLFIWLWLSLVSMIVQIVCWLIAIS